MEKIWIGCLIQNGPKEKKFAIFFPKVKPGTQKNSYLLYLARIYEEV